MRLKTIREQLLFAANDYYQKSKASLERYSALYNLKGHKGEARQARKDAAIFRKRSEAMDAAINLL
jgi:hypothetical protein